MGFYKSLVCRMTQEVLESVFLFSSVSCNLGSLLNMMLWDLIAGKHRGRQLREDSLG